jgi:hypothetical protein
VTQFTCFIVHDYRTQTENAFSSTFVVVFYVFLFLFGGEIVFAEVLCWFCSRLVAVNWGLRDSGNFS